MKFTIPSEFMGVTSEEALKLAESNKTLQNPIVVPQAVIPIPATNLRDPSAYIILEGKTHGNYSYPDLLVGMHRLGLDTDVQSAAQNLGLSVQETGQEKDGTKYLGNINWEQALKINAQLGNVTLNPRQFIDFKELLKDGIGGTRAVYDGRGNRISSLNLNSVYDEIFEVRDPWRSEWLDAKFSKVNQGLMATIKGLVKGQEYLVHYNHALNNGSLTPVTSEALESCVMSDGWIDINSFNNQGLPTKTSSDKRMYFWHPVDGRVARFLANSDRAGLYCIWDPSGTNSNLGVRAARKKI